MGGEELLIAITVNPESQCMRRSQFMPGAAAYETSPMPQTGMT